MSKKKSRKVVFFWHRNRYGLRPRAIDFPFLHTLHDFCDLEIQFLHTLQHFCNLEIQFLHTKYERPPLASLLGRKQSCFLELWCRRDAFFENRNRYGSIPVAMSKKSGHRLSLFDIEIAMARCLEQSIFRFCIPYTTFATSKSHLCIPYNTFATSKSNFCIPYNTFGVPIL